MFAIVSLDAIGAPQDTVKRVTAKQARALLEKDTTIVVLDVRTPEEFTSQTGHLPRAINIPVQELEQRWRELEKYRSREILVYCRSGNRSTRASGILQNKKFKLIHLDGGILQWNAESPPAKEKK
ncbi:MAG: rhodanese-like domain-containing protein [candidate division KSB1 bacterium]|nr:rhodanese-like domain-containing protein [candidate division KSB1 bacterium]MDZ7366707.1 rhodanese-like domain-containing protein [candidate division KSB1 bacterium]MDZ7404720.1 rhodanese-like domain-containing protein [candidate division KSB1 bacterium]